MAAGAFYGGVKHRRRWPNEVLNIRRRRCGNSSFHSQCADRYADRPVCRSRRQTRHDVQQYGWSRGQVRPDLDLAAFGLFHSRPTLRDRIVRPPTGVTAGPDALRVRSCGFNLVVAAVFVLALRVVVVANGESAARSFDCSTITSFGEYIVPEVFRLSRCLLLTVPRRAVSIYAD